MTEDKDADSDACSVAIVNTLQALYRAHQGSILYPSGHPAIREAAEAGAAELTKALAGRESLTLGIARDCILHLSRELVDSDTLKPLAELLHDLDVVAIAFNGGLTAGEFEAFSQALIEANGRQFKGREVAELIATATHDHVRIVPVNYAPLVLADGSKDSPGDAQAPNVTWADLIGALIAPSGDSQSADPQALAGQINADFERLDEADINALRQQLADVADSQSEADGGPAAPALQRLRCFAGALSPRMRRVLLRPDAANPEPSFILLNALGDDLPITEVLGALEKVDHEANRPSKEALRLYRMLARIRRQDSEHRPRIDQILRRLPAGPSTSLDDKNTALQDSLEEILGTRGTVDHSPDQYQAQLDELSGQNQALEAGAPYSSKDRFDPAELRVRAAQIAVDTAGMLTGDATDCAGPFRYLSGAIDTLIDAGRFDLLHAAIGTAQERLRKSDREDTKRAAQSYLEELRHPDRIGRLLDRIRDDDEVFSDGVKLLRLIRSSALGHIVRMLAQDPPERVRTALRSIVLSSSRADLHRVVQDLARQGGDEIRPILPILENLSPEQAIVVLEPLLTHPQADVGQEAFRIMNELCPAWPTHLLTLALCHDDACIQSLAVNRLAQEDDAQSTQLMGTFLEGELDGRLPPQSLFERVVSILVTRPESGRGRLCGVLWALCQSPRPHKVRRSKRVAQLLKPYRADPEVRRTLRRWWFSVGHLVSLLVQDESPCP